MATRTPFGKKKKMERKGIDFKTLPCHVLWSIMKSNASTESKEKKNKKNKNKKAKRSECSSLKRKSHFPTKSQWNNTIEECNSKNYVKKFHLHLGKVQNLTMGHGKGIKQSSWYLLKEYLYASTRFFWWFYLVFLVEEV